MPKNLETQGRWAHPSVNPNRRLEGTSDDKETLSLAQNIKPETTPSDLAIRSEV